LDHVHIMDPRVLQAAIDAPRWWQQHRDLVAERETVVDFSTLAIGESDNPLEKVGIRVTVGDGRPFVPRIAEQHGIRGLALNGQYELRLPIPVEEVDILIAHFGGEPPTIEAGRSDRPVVKVTADDRARQAELLRLLGAGIDRVIIHAPAEASLVQLAFPGHTRGDTGSSA
jgi:hypothetical protein